MNLLQELYNRMDAYAVNIFLEQLAHNYDALERSGCYSEDIPENTRTLIALKITAENIELRSPDSKAALRNARHFV